MPAPYGLNDDSVVVIIGSGAGGGTLGNELAQKGIDVVILEAGPRIEYEDFINDEWDSFSQLAWLDNRTTGGGWRVHKDFPNLPAWIVKAVGGTTTHWAGASLRFQEHEFKTLTNYGKVEGANLLDWPIALADLDPYYAKAEDKMGVTRTNGIEGLPGNNNFKVFKAGADKLGYKECHTGRMAINSADRDGRMGCQQTGFCFQGCKWGAKWSTLYTEIPRARRPASWRSGPTATCSRSSTTTAARSLRRRLCRQGRQAAEPEGAHRLRRRQFDREPADPAQLGLVEIPGRAWPTRQGRSARTTCATPPARSMRSSTSRCIFGAARPWPASSGTRRSTIRHAASSAATSSKRWRSACRSWRHSSIPAAGAVRSPPHSTTTTRWPACGSSARTCRRSSNAVKLHGELKDKYGMPVRDVWFSDHPNDVAMRNHAYKQGMAMYDAVGATRTFPTPPYPSTHNLGTNRMSEKASDGVVNKWGQAHDIKNLFVSDGSQFTTGAAENPTLTIVTLAIRQADYIAEQMGAKSI
jgi:choline dehydrogenase-like flavoprotein